MGTTSFNSLKSDMNELNGLKPVNPTSMKLSLIVAIAENYVIGNNNELIWHLPADLKMFRRLTTGHPIIMGRKTFDSIGKPLPNRTSIVITRNADLTIEGCIMVNSLEDATLEAQKIETTEAFIIGGAAIYELAIDLVDSMYVTEIHHPFEGDAFFPSINKDTWKEVAREKHFKDEKHAYDFDFVTYERN
jgi:dihydrofolate reductase